MSAYSTESIVSSTGRNNEENYTAISLKELKSGKLFSYR